MRLLIWIIFIVGLIAAGFLSGQTAAFIYLVITFFRRPLVLALTRLASRLGLMRGTIERMPPAIHRTRAPGPTDTARPLLAALAARVHARTRRPKKPFRPLSVGEAPRVYEQLYADEIRFRKAMGK